MIMNSNRGRDIVLSIAEGLADIDDDDEARERSTWLKGMVKLSRVDKRVLSFMKFCRDLEKTIAPAAFAEMDYVPGATVGRAKRRAIVNRLTVQHAVCLMMQGSVELMTLGEAQSTLRSNMGVFEFAKEKALKQESRLFGAGKGPSVQAYNMKAGKASALDWYSETLFAGKYGTERNDAISPSQKNCDEKKGAGKHTQTKRKADHFEDDELDFQRAAQHCKAALHEKAKPVVIGLIDETLMNSVTPEVKLGLLKECLALLDREAYSQDVLRTTREGLEKLLRPLIHRVTESIRHSQKLQYTK